MRLYSQSTAFKLHSPSEALERAGNPVESAVYIERHLYTRWLKLGITHWNSPPAAADAIRTGAGRGEYYVLPFSYRHLSPVLDAPPAPEWRPRRAPKAEQ